MAGPMYVDVFDRNDWGTNCWLLGADGVDEAVAIDVGFDPDGVRGVLARGGRRPVAVLLTHAHLDHATQAGAFAGDDLPVLVHHDDAAAFDDPDGWARGPGAPLTAAKDLRTLDDGQVLRVAGLRIEVLHTPGHTPGHCCFLVEGEALLCAGDLVFAGSIGRSDFPNSDPAAMRASLERFLSLPDELRILPGHGPESTVGRERATNPFLAGLA